MNSSELWPTDLDLTPVRIPFQILQEQAGALDRIGEGRIRAEVSQWMEGDGDPRPFQYCLWICDIPPDSSIAKLSYMVVRVVHGTEVFPLTVYPGALNISCEGDFSEFLRKRLASREVGQAIRILASQAVPECNGTDLLPEEYDFASVRTPHKILLEQGWFLKKRTDGLVKGVVRGVGATNSDNRSVFQYTFHIETGRTTFFTDLRYLVVRVEHGPEIYPVRLHPGDVILKSETDFVEYVRQELASEDVRQAIRVIASTMTDNSIGSWLD